jgi:hypothetical protein|tara:strand:- start:2454 stop:3839 length:1386 start_codon:yes stop_codon:yes gene_type:complete
MAVSIDQRPLYRVLPIGQQVMFSVSEPTTVATKFKVKFVAEVRVSSSAGINPNSSDDLIGTFKTTPNNAGVGMFDLRPILETFVSPDNEPSSTANATYKGIPNSFVPFPIHLVDKYTLSDKSIKFFAVRFLVESATDATGSVGAPTLEVDSAEFTMFNGVLQYDDVLTESLFGNDYGYNLQNFELTDNDSQFLSNAPTTQYARLTDYGTFPFLNFVPNSTDKVSSLTLKYYNSSGVQLGTDEDVPNQTSNGGVASLGGSNTMLNYFGGFPANLDGWSTIWDAHKANISYYTIQDTNGESVLYRINILCPNLKGFEAIRLAWLNQWGTWDYYTFNMKSTRSIQTNRTSYTQLGGTWNESTFKISDYKGGKKNFRVNSTEKIKLNTDFVTEAEGVWLEELINSNEVYIVNGFSSDVSNTITNKYIDPVVLTTSSYVKKTIANDKLMQYTIEIEKSKMKRTQAV